ncbi:MULTISPECIES: anti sigma factor C-terminal domain-containing protein [Cytobacillus]|uniref:anti sigma factor C-terminal domain-containing protein n=1 Tax=Cytobacillus TaxID=2675230 RepID=UPI002480D92D|nr:anti sigma factor C-terminal domain-containing protein [Cytobacillus kochii]MDM5205671.1 anti sigma factor C-terminal domain-containing protein [Cytobacillus kochii]
MTNHKKGEVDFISDSLFRHSIKKARWKQFGLYFLISTISVLILIFLVFSGVQYLINKKIDSGFDDNLNRLSKGAGVISNHTSFHYNLFSALGETVYYKEIGGRQFVWDKETKEYPAIGEITTVSRLSGLTEMNKVNEETKRVVRYNQMNNERITDFYYPQIKYSYLPQEIDIAVGLDKNTLIEVAISFDEPITTKELGEIMGAENIDWLWVNKYTPKQIEGESDSHHVLNADNAYGYSVSEDDSYYKNESETLISGAVISGTPEELERFREISIIRASVLGVTIDKY